MGVLAAFWAGAARAEMNAGYYNPTRDFSIARGNPNGVWTYGWMTTDFIKFTPYDGKREDVLTNRMWYRTSPASGDFTPCVWLNRTSSTLYGAAPGQLVLHPSSATEASVVRWTAPAPGFYRIRGEFFPGDSGKMSVGVRRTRYDNFMSSGSASGMYERFLWTATDSGAFDIFYSTDDDSPLSFFMTGESVDFVVYGGYGSGNTPLRAEIIRQTPPLPTYDAAAEFSVTQGSHNGVWTYGWMSTDFSSVTAFTDARLTDTKVLQWYRTPASPDFTPTIWRNDNTVPQYGVAPGQVSLHPSSTYEPSVLRWVAPMPGEYKVRAHFFPGDTGIMKVGVRKTTYDSAGQSVTTWEFQRDDSGFYESANWCEAGATFDFLVYGAYASGNTPLEVVIIAHPSWTGYSIKSPRYDPTTEFGTASNPNGVWTYGWKQSALLTFAPYTGVTQASATSSAAWWRSPQSPDFTPTVWLRNPTIGAGYGVAPGELALHPSSTKESSVLRFTAPADGTYGINARFFPGDVGDPSVGIRQGTAWLWAARDSGSIHLYRTLKASDTVDFMVYGAYGSANTPLHLTVTPQVSAPTAIVSNCQESSGLPGHVFTISGTCEAGTEVGLDHGLGGATCIPNGTYVRPYQFAPAGATHVYLRGIQSGRAPSALVPVSLAACNY